jgi:hypothetical protein
MEKLDFKKQMASLYSPKVGQFTQVKVPKMNFLMVDGAGDPNTSKEYSTAIELLYTISYTLKFMSKKELAQDYTVPPLEGLWWADDMTDFVKGNKKQWKWTAMIMLPSWITVKHFNEAVRTAQGKKPELDFSRIRRESFTEGLSVQTLFIGPYSDEGPVIKELHSSYLPAAGLVENGNHHEIYLSDPRKVVASKLKTIIRQPAKRIGRSSKP